VVINLATNDFNANKGAPPDEKEYIEAYKQLIGIVRGNYPDATIYMASGSMMSDAWPANVKSLSTLKGWLATIQSDLQAAGDKKLHVIHFPPQNGGRDGIGASWHPSLKTHQRMADQLATQIKQDMGW
jgi:hypothetical protein